MDIKCRDATSRAKLRADYHYLIFWILSDLVAIVYVLKDKRTIHVIEFKNEITHIFKHCYKPN